MCLHHSCLYHSQSQRIMEMWGWVVEWRPGNPWTSPLLLLKALWFFLIHLYCCCSVPQLCLILCNPMDCSTPGFPVLHHLPEFAQTPVYWVGDAIQPSHLLSSPFPPALNLSQHQGFFQWVSSSHQVAKSIGASVSVSVLPMSIQDWFPLGLTGLISCCPRDS